MRFFFSGELDVEVVDRYRPVRQKVESRLNSALGTKSYGEAINTIALIPIIVSSQFTEGRKERRLLKRGEKVADYRLFIDHQAFVIAGDQGREQLLVQNLLIAVKDIHRKLKGAFDGQALQEDIRALFPEVSSGS